MSADESLSTSPTANVSRRRALLAAALFSGPFGACTSRPREASRGASGMPRPTSLAREPAERDAAPRSGEAHRPSAWGGLSVVMVSAGRDDGSEPGQGGDAVVLLHGWGAPGDDLVPLAHELAPSRPGVRFFVPAAPLVERGGGRAWWHLDPQTRPPHATSEQLAPGFRPSPAVVAARTALQELLVTLRDRHAPARVALVGFSQGAMLALDVALQSASHAEAVPVDRVVAMSGVLLADAVPALVAPAVRRPRFFVSHGRHDHVVPFEGGRRAAELLEARGFPTTFSAFDGDHEIPAALVSEAGRFLFED